MATLDEVVAQLQKNNRSEAGRDSHHTRHFKALATSITNLQKTVATIVTPQPAPPAPPSPPAPKQTISLLQQLLNFTKINQTKSFQSAKSFINQV